MDTSLLKTEIPINFNKLLKDYFYKTFLMNYYNKIQVLRYLLHKGNLYHKRILLLYFTNRFSQKYIYKKRYFMIKKIFDFVNKKQPQSLGKEGLMPYKIR